MQMYTATTLHSLQFVLAKGLPLTRLVQRRHSCLVTLNLDRGVFQVVHPQRLSLTSVFQQYLDELLA
jgi:hypothetical protein